MLGFLHLLVEIKKQRIVKGDKDVVVKKFSSDRRNFCTKYYCGCGNEMDSESKMCIACYSIIRRKVERPSYVTLGEKWL